MPGIVRKFVRRVRRKFASRRQQQRTWSFYDAGERLLAMSDHEQMTVAKLCQEAGSSIGTFYNRFGDKEGFLYRLISARFSAAEEAAEQELGAPIGTEANTSECVQKIVQHVVTRMGGPRTIGVTRAALKLGSTRPEVLEPIAKYRTVVSDRAVGLLTPDLAVSDPALMVRMGLQVVFATVIDATLRNDGPLRTGESSTVDALTDVMTRCLDIEPNNWRAQPEAFDEAAASANNAEKTDGDDDASQSNLIGVIDPDLRVQVGSLRMADRELHQNSSRRPRVFTRAQAGNERLPTTVTPARVSPRATEESSEENVRTEPKRRRHRWI
jgi:AcrR family transcriptional regulator